MKMGLKDASNKDKMDKTIYQSDYFTGYGVKDWDAISWSMNGPVQVDVDWLWTVEQIVKSEIAWKYPVQSWGHLGTWPVRYCFEVNKILQTFPGLSVTVICSFLQSKLHHCIFRDLTARRLFISHMSRLSIAKFIMNRMWTNDVIMMSLRNLAKSLQNKRPWIYFCEKSKKTNFQ